MQVTIHVPEAAVLRALCLDRDGAPVGGVYVTAWTDGPRASSGTTGADGVATMANLGTTRDIREASIDDGPLMPREFRPPFEMEGDKVVLRSRRGWKTWIRVVDALDKSPVEQYAVAAADARLLDGWSDRIRLEGKHDGGWCQVDRLFAEDCIVTVFPRNPDYWPTGPVQLRRAETPTHAQALEVRRKPILRVQVSGVPSSLRDGLRVVCWRPNPPEFEGDLPSTPGPLEEWAYPILVDELSLIVDEAPVEDAESLELRTPPQDAFLISYFRGDEELGRSIPLEPGPVAYIADYQEMRSRLKTARGNDD